MPSLIRNFALAVPTSQRVNDPETSPEVSSNNTMVHQRLRPASTVVDWHQEQIVEVELARQPDTEEESEYV